MAKSKTSRKWLDRHVNDEYVKRSLKDGYRSRAAYKLLELDEKSRFFKPGQVVVDLGAAPGGWLQVAHQKVGKKGRVIGIDLLEIEPIPEIHVIQDDFRESRALQELRNILENTPVDLVLSDMSPNISGLMAVDQPRAMYLCELALDFARENLAGGGWFVCKVFQGEGFDDFLREVRQSFQRVVMRKPKASRPKSREMYLVAGNYKL